MIRIEQLRVWMASRVERLQEAVHARAPGVRSAAQAAHAQATRSLESNRRRFQRAADVANEKLTEAGEVARQAARVAGERLQVAGEAAQQAAHAAGERLQEAGEAAQQAAQAANEKVGPIAANVEPQARRASSELPAVMQGALGGTQPVLSRAVGAVRHQLRAGSASRATPRELRDARGRRLRASAYAYGPENHRIRRRPRAGVPQVGALSGGVLKIAAVGLIASFAFLGSSSAFINYAADLPDAHNIAYKPLPEDTRIYAADGTLLADIRDNNQPQHYYESLDQMGKWLPEATVAVEDQNFWTEPGIDVFAMGRAAWVDYRSHGTVQGASTITQQLVKLRLLNNQVSIDRKVREAILAIQVEHTYTKRQILEQYLNAVDYSNNAKGSLAGSQIYFHKATKDLDLAEASMLAGIPQSPHYNSPFLYWDHARARQLQVLNAMVRNHYITQEEADEAYAEDISPPDHMFTPQPQVLAAPGFVSYVTETLISMYGEAATYGGGLQVHTTLNMQLQSLAQKAVNDGVNNGRAKRVTQGAMTAIDPRTGAILAMVGNDPQGPDAQDNLATKPRNPGSSMKMFTYTAAINSKKFTMSTMIPDTPVSVGMCCGMAAWQPKNYDGGYHGTLQLQQAMGNSLNVPAVKTEMAIGVNTVADMAKNMGAPPFYQPDTNVLAYTTDAPSDVFGPTLTLGGYAESTLHMATGASVLGAQGVYHASHGVGSIQTSDGTIIMQSDPNQGARQALDPKVAYIMEQIMSNNQNRQLIFGSSAINLILPDRKVAAKTGTTDEWHDGWTVGYTPAIASAFWFGRTDGQPMAPQYDGVFAAAPYWHEFMQSATDDILKEPTSDWFAEPPGLGHATVGGEPVWLLPGTSANQPMPALPSFVSSGGSTTNNRRPGG